MLKVIVYRGEDATTICNLAKAQGLSFELQSSRTRYAHVQVPYEAFMGFMDDVAKYVLVGELMVVDYYANRPIWVDTVWFRKHSWQWLDFDPYTGDPISDGPHSPIL